MCRIFEEYGNEIREEATRVFAERLLVQQKLTKEEIAEAVGIPLAQVEEIAQKLAVPEMA